MRGRRLFAGHWWTATSGTSLPRAVLPQVDGANHPQQSDNFAPSMMIAAMVLTEVAVEIVASEIAWSELGTRLDGQYAVGMSDATPPPMSSAEQLAEWRALVDRIGQGDRSQVVAWNEVAAVGPVATYQVLVTQQVRQRLRAAPPMLVGSVAGIIAVLRVDPTEASMIFRLRRLGDGGWTVTFGAAQGLLTYWVVQAEQLVVLLDLTWAG
jgi:hypothetical protein